MNVAALARLVPATHHASTVRVHLHVDTGMARGGCSHGEWDELIGLARRGQRDRKIRVVGLMHARTDQQPRALRFAFSNRRSFELIRFAGSVTGALAAADVCVWDSPAPSLARHLRLPVHAAATSGPVLAMAAAAAGFPIIARDEPLTRDVLEPASAACLLPSDQEHLFAGAILRMAEPAHRTAAGAALHDHVQAGSGVLDRWTERAELAGDGGPDRERRGLAGPVVHRAAPWTSASQRSAASFR